MHNKATNVVKQHRHKYYLEAKLLSLVVFQELQRQDTSNKDNTAFF